MFCQKCGAENANDAAFCNSCGADLRQAPVTPTPVLQSEMGVSPVPAGKKRNFVLYGGLIVCFIVVILIVGAVFAWNNQDWNSYCSKNYPGGTYDPATKTCEQPVMPPTPAATQAGPHAAPIFHTGDIIWFINNNPGQGMLIEKYDANADNYTVTWADQSLDGTWFHDTYPALSGDEAETRTYVESQWPYKVGTADPNNFPLFASAAPLVLTGSGSDLKEFGTPDAGGYIFTCNYSGDSNFVVWIKDSSGYEVGLAANTVGSCNGSKMIHLNADTYYAEVTADGPWTLTITPPS